MKRVSRCSVCGISGHNARSHASGRLVSKKSVNLKKKKKIVKRKRVKSSDRSLVHDLCNIIHTKGKCPLILLTIAQDKKIKNQKTKQQMIINSIKNNNNNKRSSTGDDFFYCCKCFKDLDSRDQSTMCQSCFEIEVCSPPTISNPNVLPAEPQRMKPNCPICIDVITECMALVCGHCFCKPCITAWLSRSNSCPICRHAQH